jgi:hypothetical protein
MFFFRVTLHIHLVKISLKVLKRNSYQLSVIPGVIVLSSFVVLDEPYKSHAVIFRLTFCEPDASLSALSCVYARLVPIHAVSLLADLTSLH